MSAFGDAFKAARASGAKEFTFGGKRYTTAIKGEASPSKASARDIAQANNSADPIGTLNAVKKWTDADARDAEAGNSRGTRPSAGAGRGGQGGPTAAQLRGAGAGRGGQGGPTAAEQANADADNAARASDSERKEWKADDDTPPSFKKGGQVKAKKRGWGKARGG